MPDIISEFRQRYPQYSDIPDAQVYMKLADPKMFKQAFPEYPDLDDHTIGKNIAAEAGKVDTGQPWYKQAASDIGAIGSQIKENIMTGGKSGQAATLNQNKKIAEDAAARKAEGRSLPYRAAAGAVENLGLFSPRPMEEAANAGHPGEVVGHGVAAAAPYIAPLAIEGVVGAGKAVRSAAMEEPAVARQRAFNVTPKSKQAVRAQVEGTAAAPYLQGAKNLADVQAKIPVAKQEIFQPYMDAVAAHDATGTKLTAPDGSPVTAAQLEDLRQQTSAQLQSTRKMQPTEQWNAVQKGQQIKQLTDQYKAITDELDPAIKNQGIDPKRTRAAFGAVKGVEKRFEGRSTLLENAPSGVQKMAGVDITKPETLVGAPASGARDIVAGRGWWNQKPTDVQVREGFRTAGPKPDLTVQPQPPARGLPAAPLVTPPPQPGAPNLTPPAIAPTSRAQRLGLLLPEQSVSSARPQVPTGYTEPAAPGTVHYGEVPPKAPVTATEAPAGQTPNRRIVRDPATGKMKIQYLTSSGGEIVREAPPVKPKQMNSGGEDESGFQLSKKAAADETSSIENKLEDAIRKSGADPNFAATRAKSLADMVEGRGSYSGAERRSAPTLINHYLDKFAERRGTSAAPQEIKGVTDILKTLPSEHTTGLKSVKPESGGARYYRNTIHIDPDEVPNMLVHEVGHHVQSRLVPQAASEWNKLSAGEKSPLAKVISSIDSKKEHFVESYDMFKDNPDLLKKHDPTAFAFMKRVFENPKEMLKGGK